MLLLSYAAYGPYNRICAPVPTEETPLPVALTTEKKLSWGVTWKMCPRSKEIPDWDWVNFHWHPVKAGWNETIHTLFIYFFFINDKQKLAL